MSSITQASATTWSHPQVRIPFLQDLTWQPDEFFARLPFIGIDGPSFKLTQVDVPDPQAYVVGGTMGTRVVDPTANPGTAFAGADASAKDAYNAVAPGDPAFAEFFLKDIVGDSDQSNILRRLYSNANDLRAQQVDMKLQVLRFHYSQMLINGVGTTATARDFAGLTTLVTAAQTRAGTGVLHVDLDAAEFLVRARQGKADYFVMDFLTFGLYLKGLRATGCTPERIPDPIRPGGFRVAHNGIPIYRSHALYTAPATYPTVPVDTPFTTAFYCGTFGLESGGLVGLFNNNVGSNGVTIEYVGQATDADYDTTRVSWSCGLALGSESTLVKFTESLAAVAPYGV